MQSKKFVYEVILKATGVKSLPDMELEAAKEQFRKEISHMNIAVGTVNFRVVKLEEK